MKDTRSTELLAILCTATLFVWSVSFAALFDRDNASPFVQKFSIAFNEGADCPRLFELRNDAKRQGADNEQQKMMNEKLRSVGCIDIASKRVPIGPPNTGNFTVKDYKIYHEAVTTPMSVPESQNLGNIAKKYKLSVADMRKTVDKVMRNLSENNWMIGSPASQIRHASDWNGETP